jgi:hypothetical protein
MKKILLSLCLLFAPVAKAETIMIPVQDLLYEIPNFEAPKFNFNAALEYSNIIGDLKKSKRERKEAENKLINLLYELYPDATSIKIYRGTLIIRID